MQDIDLATAGGGVWDDDVVGRKPFADFLTAYLAAKVVKKDSPASSFTLALDAGWGRGKSFLIDRWAKDLRAAPTPYPVVVFNAWAADIATDPLIAFMAELRASIKVEIAAAGLLPTASEMAATSLDDAVRKIRRAAWPTAKYVGKAILKKASGISLDDLSEVMTNGIDLSDVERLRDEAMEGAGGALDVFFEKAMEEQRERGALVKAFKASIGRTLNAMVDGGQRRLPMFVFVDEIDRCRPTFAIELLEALKHFFGVKGICFVITTNIAQLSESIKAVYGQGFDGRTYLNRFFDSTYALPSVSSQRFASLLAKSSPLEGSKNLVLCWPDHGFEDEPKNASVESVFTWVSSALDLSFRSQEQVYEMVAASVASARGEQVLLLWLVCLCAIRHLNVEAFELLAGHPAPSQAVFENTWEQLARENDSFRKYKDRVKTQGGSTWKELTTRLGPVAGVFYKNSLHVEKNFDAVERARDEPYPANLLHAILGVVPPNARQSGMRSPIQHYFELVRSAGYLSS